MNGAKYVGVPLTMVGHLDRLLVNTCNDDVSHQLTGLGNEKFTARVKANNPVIKQDLAKLEGKDVVVVGVPALSGAPECHYINVYLVFDLATRVAQDVDTKSIRSIEIGRIKTHRESKLEWPGPTLRCRDHYVCAYADIEVPDDLADDLWRRTVNCAVGAGIAAGVAAIIASPAAALATFKAVFDPCITQELGQIATRITVALHTNEATGDWGAC